VQPIAAEVAVEAVLALAALVLVAVDFLLVVEVLELSHRHRSVAFLPLFSLT
jgi:hypothetical protein